MYDRTRSSSRHAPVIGTVLLLSIVACSTDEEPPATGAELTVGREIPEVVTAEALESMTMEQIWKLGVRHLHWDPIGPPEGVPKATLVEWYLEDEEIKDIKDVGYGDGVDLRETGYADDD